MDILSHIKRGTSDDRFPLPLWETWFCASLGVPIPVLVTVDLLNRVHAAFFIMINLVTMTIYRHARLNRCHDVTGFNETFVNFYPTYWRARNQCGCNVFV